MICAPSNIGVLMIWFVSMYIDAAITISDGMLG